MKQIILGTAGHIDHGKTSLIKAVTNIDTDRLKEEKLRGITIELGFAYLDLPSGQHLGIVDVPGHEKFVKNMVAGATGIDIVAIVIAADEGVMAQTREHLEICTLLQIKQGLVVLTKTDLVDEEWMNLVIEDIKEFTRGTFLEGKPVLPVSSVTGYGISEFVKTLDELSAATHSRPVNSLFRLPIDRVFSIKGFGTVITGTLISGYVTTGDTVMIYPSGIKSKVRGIQIYNKNVSTAEAGMRTAINLQGLEKASVQRGEVVSSPGALRPTYMFDVSIHFLKSNKKPIKNRTLIRFHTGTKELLGYIILLDKNELIPGDTTIAQIRLDSPVVIVKDDKFVIRSYSPICTIGGGQILNPLSPKHKRLKKSIFEGLKALLDKSPEEIITYHIDNSGYRGILFSDLKIMTNIPEKQLAHALQKLMSRKTVICADRGKRIYIHKSCFENINKKISFFLENYHRINPLKAGMFKEELKSKLPKAGSKIFNTILQMMIKNKKIVSEGDTIRLFSHNVSLKSDLLEVKEKILSAYFKSGLYPPYFKDLTKKLDVDSKKAKDILMLLIEAKIIIKIKEELYFHSDVVNNLKKKLVDFLLKHGEINTPQFKEMTGTTRKYLIPLIEHFDSEKVTIRIGDVRKLRSSSETLI